MIHKIIFMFLYGFISILLINYTDAIPSPLTILNISDDLPDESIHFIKNKMDPKPTMPEIKDKKIDEIPSGYFPIVKDGKQILLRVRDWSKNDKYPNDILGNLQNLFDHINDQSNKQREMEPKNKVEHDEDISYNSPAEPNKPQKNSDSDIKNQDFFKKHFDNKICLDKNCDTKGDDENDNKNEINSSNHYHFDNAPQIILIRDGKIVKPKKENCKEGYVFYINDNDKKDKTMVDIVKVKT